jgi:hypothetical protein
MTVGFSHLLGGNHTAGQGIFKIAKGLRCALRHGVVDFPQSTRDDGYEDGKAYFADNGWKHFLSPMLRLI